MVPIHTQGLTSKWFPYSGMLCILLCLTWARGQICTTYSSGWHCSTGSCSWKLLERVSRFYGCFFYLCAGQLGQWKLPGLDATLALFRRTHYFHSLCCRYKNRFMRICINHQDPFTTLYFLKSDLGGREHAIMTGTIYNLVFHLSSTLQLG